ncbi:LamG domain-containing protein, partial [Flavihumibacter sediminis]|nr:LamG domain-containing protein [Flavihumibacter sediminis]
NNHGAINFANDHITEMRIGNGPGNNLDSDDWLSSSWKGELDQVRLYGDAISAAEVQALFNSKK